MLRNSIDKGKNEKDNRCIIVIVPSAFFCARLFTKAQKKNESTHKGGFRFDSPAATLGSAVHQAHHSWSMADSNGGGAASNPPHALIPTMDVHSSFRLIPEEVQKILVLFRDVASLQPLSLLLLVTS
jgi:hypothetical protein